MDTTKYKDGGHNSDLKMTAKSRSPNGGVLTKQVQLPVWFLLVLLLAHGLSQGIGILILGGTGNIGSGVWGTAPITTLASTSRGLRGDPTNDQRALGPLSDEANVPLPVHTDGTPLTIEERLRYLELKTNAHFNFGSNPFFGSQVRGGCTKKSDLREFGCVPGSGGYHEDRPLDSNCRGYFDHYVCLDRLPTPNANNETRSAEEDPPCLVYDFGIRDMPTFGKIMAETFGCEVHAFDPSPVSAKWWKSDRAKELRELPNYHFHDNGAGGIDGELELNEYDWGQVSIIKFPSHMVDCEDNDDIDCKRKYTGNQKTFNLKVKTLPTIIKELGHEGRKIDILKVDVEGSEYAFMENIFDHTGGCPDFIEQVTLEWHHMPWDVRYGEGSSPSINAIVTLLHTCGLKMFWQHSPGGWLSTGKMFFDLGMKDVRYNLASFIREP
jgi:FkbM family methyltransferase